MSAPSAERTSRNRTSGNQPGADPSGTGAGGIEPTSRPPLRSSDLPMCCAIALAMILATLALSPLTVDRSFWLLAGLTVLILEGLSALGHRLRLAPWLIHLVQLLVLAAIGVGLGLSAAHELGLTGSLPSQLWQLCLNSSVVAQTQPAPMPAHVGVRWLTVLLVGVVTILADVLTLSLESPVWATAPLLTIYVIPALAAEQAATWWSFALIAVGYLVVLATEQFCLSRRWTRNLSGDTARASRVAAGVPLAGLGTALAVPAVVLSLVLGSALPTFGSLDIDSARPRGSGPMQLTDPTIDLQQNLTTQSRQVVLSYQTSSRTGEYLRMASLTRVDASGWHLAPVDLSTTAPDSTPGLDIASSRRTVQVSIGDFGSEFLPAPYAPVSTTAGGQWSWDPGNLTIISTSDDRDDATRNLRYSVTSEQPDLDTADFASAAAGTPADRTTVAVPKDTPQAIIRLARSVTAGATTPVERAAAIQDYLRDPRRFTYSTSAPPGDGFDVMTNFLTRSRSGYCIHFAAAMALMARVEGIPSRVSIGFLPGTRTNGAWQVRGSNMHAWPELYFQGYGWVRYEPTAAVGQSPTWSVQNPNSVPQTQSSADATESASAAATPSAPSASTSAGAASSAPASSQESGPSLPWRTILMSLAGVLVVALLACTPMLLRAGRRRRRLSSGDPSALVAGAWREVHDSWTDHGLSWAALSPRAQLAAVSDQLGPEGAAALGRLAGAEERARYARSLGEIGDVGGDVEVIRKGLAAADTPRAHWLATWWPRSLWHR
ncbi:transglutaminase domain-containing protein [Acidipropionibacterium jensenii]|uniref:transglutaminase family protein n=1 Tax=Acidipropionibacterium jensenii TaxID=1749 RepID=UPI00110A7365|nr:DUF3488 and transglutaminase-like domain-containing protein [Acidipropionibacterium jensenii]QCV86989.1 transglutaminase domain-containing protein [Acidipropionibacterium jensenii]